MIAVPRGVVMTAFGDPPGIRDLGSQMTTRSADILALKDPLSEATTALAATSGEALQALLDEADAIPARIDGLASVYEEIAEILQGYADAVSDNNASVVRWNNEFDAATIHLELARMQCLATDPTFPGTGLPWDYAPSHYMAPHLDGLWQWHDAIARVQAAQAALAVAQTQRADIDHDAAQELRGIDAVHGADIGWFDRTAPLRELGSAGKDSYDNATDIASYARTTREMRRVENAPRTSRGNFSRTMRALDRVRLEDVTGSGPFGEATRQTTMRLLNGASRLTSRSGPVSTGLSTAARGLANPALVRTLTMAGKVAGPVGAGLAISDGVDHVLHPEYDGTRGVIDQAVGIASIAGGTAALLALGGVLAIGVAGPIVLGAGLVVGAWALGNAIYDNWDSITGVTSAAWDATANFTQERVADALAVGHAAADAVTDRVDSITDGVSSATKTLGGIFT